MRVRFWYAIRMEKEAKARENRARRKAERQGYKLGKSRLRDPDATGYGTYTLTPAKGRARTFKSIDAVEEFLTRGRESGGE